MLESSADSATPIVVAAKMHGRLYSLHLKEDRLSWVCAVEKKSVELPLADVYGVKVSSSWGCT